MLEQLDEANAGKPCSFELLFKGGQGHARNVSAEKGGDGFALVLAERCQGDNAANTAERLVFPLHLDKQTVKARLGTEKGSGLFGPVHVSINSHSFSFATNCLMRPFQ